MEQKALASWSWKHIEGVYQILGDMLEEYRGLHERIGFPKPHITFSDDLNILLLRFWGDVKRINDQLTALDVEIARRNNLIGVIG